MATEKQVEVKAETIVEETVADAPKKNAVAAETSPLKNEAEDLGAAVVKPTDSNPDATKKSKKVSTDQNAKAADVDASKKPDTEAGVTKVATPGESLKVEETEEEINLSDDVKALIGDEKLTEEFKTRAATIFEAAVKSKIKEAKSKMEVMHSKKLKEEVDAVKAELVEKVDSYLNYVVEEWMKSNEIAVERGIKGEIAEDFITGLKKLFEDHYINVPDEKYDVLEDQASTIEELNKKLNEQIENNVKLNSEIGKLTRQDIVDAVSSDLADTNKEKFNKLAEEIDYTNADEFKAKVSTIKESYFAVKEISSKNEIDSIADDETTHVDLTKAMSAYAAAITKTKNSIILGKK